MCNDRTDLPERGGRPRWEEPQGAATNCEWEKQSLDFGVVGRGNNETDQAQVWMTGVDWGWDAQGKLRRSGSIFSGGVLSTALKALEPPVGCSFHCDARATRQNRRGVGGANEVGKHG